MAFEGAAASAPAGILRRVLAHVMRPVAAVFAALAWVVGLLVLVFLLGFLAAMPGLNLIALGVLLDAGGRVARSGRILDGFPLVPLAPRVGSAALGVWLWLLPIALLGSLASDAAILHPGSRADVNLHQLLHVAQVALVLHLALALAAGGRFSRFFRPLKNLRELIGDLRAGAFWEPREKALRDALFQVSLKHHFWLGLRGFAGAALWLWLPTALLAYGDRNDRPGLLTFVGAFLLMRVLCWIPFLQLRFAAEDRFAAFFEVAQVKEAIGRAPFAALVALLITLALSLPLFLFKIVLPPRDALWLVTPLFIAGLYPGKLLTGWTLHRAAQRSRPAWAPLRWLARLLTIPVVAAFVFILFFMQFAAEHGKGVLFEHHAFLLWIGG